MHRTILAASSVLLLTAAHLALADPSLKEAPDPPSMQTTQRVYVRAALRPFDFDITLDDRATPVSEDFSYERARRGVDFAVGYDFGPRFGAEVDFGATALETRPKEASAFLANAMLVGLVPILRYGAHELRVAGGIGVTAFYQDGPDFPERTYLGTAGLVGLRLRLQVQRHLRVSTGADYTVQDTRWEAVPSNDPDHELRDVGGTAWIRSVFAGLEVCF